MVKANEMKGLGIATLVALSVSSLGCEDKPVKTAPSKDAGVVAADAGTDAAQPPPAPKIEIVYDEGDPPTADTVLVSANDVKVTFADFEHMLKINRLMQPGAPAKLDPIPPDRLALPAARFTTARSILMRKMIEKVGADRKLKVSDKEAKAWLKNDPQFKRYGDILGTPEFEKALKTVGLTEDELLVIAKGEVMRKKLAEVLVNDISDEEVWQRYAFEMTTVRVAATMALNVPQSGELTEFVQNNPDKIEAYFKENSRSFRVPKKVVLDTLSPPQGTEPDAAKLKKAAELLKTKSALLVAQELGLEAKEGVQMIKQQNGEAFRADKGVTGHFIDKNRGAYAWIVKDFKQSYIPELDRGLKRQVAAEMMRRDGLTPETAKRLKSTYKALKRIGDGKKVKRIEAARTAAQKNNVQFEVVGPFNKSPNGSMPTFGLAPEVVAAAFDLTTKKRTTKEPVYSRERGFMVHLIERTEPSRDVFEENKDAFMERYKTEARGSIAERFVQLQLSKENPVFDLSPLNVKYGIIKK